MTRFRIIATLVLLGLLVFGYLSQSSSNTPKRATKPDQGIRLN
jgi:hypothetical protein